MALWHKGLQAYDEVVELGENGLKLISVPVDLGEPQPEVHHSFNQGLGVRVVFWALFTLDRFCRQYVDVVLLNDAICVHF